MNANPDALTDPNVENFLSRNELVNAVHALNRGDAFVPTRSMQALAVLYLSMVNVIML